MDTDNQDRRQQAEIIRGVIAVAVLWFLFVVATGLLQMRKGGDASFTVTGEFGDSFGFIGAIMASTAAYFAYRTYQAQSEETRLLRRERAEAARLRAEPSFLNLLERRYDALNQFSYAPVTTSFTGLDGIDRLAAGVVGDLINYKMSAIESYVSRIANATNHQHLFRFTYHIVRYAELHFDGSVNDERDITRKDLSYRYVSLLRSQMSDSELFVLALNVMTREGTKAKRLYERFALFHNLSEERQKIIKAAGSWDERAFGLPPDDSARN